MLIFVLSLTLKSQYLSFVGFVLIVTIQALLLRILVSTFLTFER